MIEKRHVEQEQQSNEPPEQAGSENVTAAKPDKKVRAKKTLEGAKAEEAERPVKVKKAAAARKARLTTFTAAFTLSSGFARASTYGTCLT